MSDRHQGDGLLCIVTRTGAIKLAMAGTWEHKAHTSMYLRDTFTLYADSFHNLDPFK